jgi:hypothetical protein
MNRLSVSQISEIGFPSQYVEARDAHFILVACGGDEASCCSWHSVPGLCSSSLANTAQKCYSDCGRTAPSASDLADDSRAEDAT